MRRVHRPALPATLQTYLDRKQPGVNAQNIERIWKSARKTKTVGKVLKTLQAMMGSRARCMYCVDSYGSDIEHFWPKAPYPEHAFRWSNMLLCCTECGRLKGSRFPLLDGEPLLVDPSIEDPWQHLDFDPDTGNLSARFDPVQNAYSRKGEETVQALNLDQREGMASGNKRTYNRLVKYVREALQRNDLNEVQFVEGLHEADDHGLLGWCFTGTGARLEPFVVLQREAPELWAAGVAAAQ